MNTQMTGGLIRHIITVIAGTIIAEGSTSLDTVIPTMIEHITTGDVNAIVGSALAVIAVLWSMWVKATEKTKENVVKIFTLKGNSK